MLIRNSFAGSTTNLSISSINLSHHLHRYYRLTALYELTQRSHLRELWTSWSSYWLAHFYASSVQWRFLSYIVLQYYYFIFFFFICCTCCEQRCYNIIIRKFNRYCVTVLLYFTLCHDCVGLCHNCHVANKDDHVDDDDFEVSISAHSQLTDTSWMIIHAWLCVCNILYIDVAKQQQLLSCHASRPVKYWWRDTASTGDAPSSAPACPLAYIHIPHRNKT